MIKKFYQVLAAALGLCAWAGVAAAADVADEYNENWPTWRGPWANGVAATAAPVDFDATKNVKWKIKTPGRGFGTPIIWGDKIFITASIMLDDGKPDEEPAPAEGGRRRRGGGMLGSQEPTGTFRLVVVCLDRGTGETIWQETVRDFKPHEGFHFDGTPDADRSLSSYANQSLITDGEYLYASFGSRGGYCYDMDGNQIWGRDFEDPSTGETVKMQIYNRFGESSSAGLYGETAVYLFDHEGQSFMEAVNKRTGKTTWKIERDTDTTWGSPFAFEHDGLEQVAVIATEGISCYDLGSGALLWTCQGTSPHPVPSPVIGGGLLFASSGTREREIRVIKLGNTGDLTDTDAVAWKMSKAATYDPSPLLWDSELYLVRDGGLARGTSMLSNFVAETGEIHYLQKRLPSAYTVKASPTGAGDKIYMLSEEGDCIIVERGPEYKVVAVNTMGEMFLASPVVVKGELFLRSNKSLFCISEQ